VARTKASSHPVWPSEWLGHQVSPDKVIADILTDPGFPQFLLDIALKSALGPTQPPIQWVLGVLSPG
jgi:hypothetical protein